jgi:hypothetical protein
MNQELLKQLFDYKDGNLFWKKNKKQITNIEPIGYVRVCLNKKQYKAHRVIFLMHHGYLPEYIDHIDGNKLNNKIENLRPATRQQNGQNSVMRKNNKSGAKGVCWSKPTNKWRVQINVNKEKKYFGVYKDLELAELVAIEARNKYHNNFARHK